MTNHIRKRHLLIPILILFFSSFATALEPVVVGKWISKTGEVILPVRQPAELQNIVAWGDQIITGNTGKIRLVLYPGLAITIGSNTRLKIIGNLVQKAGQTVLAETALNLISGKIAGRLDKSNEVSQKVKVFTNRSISSIRGTEFQIEDESVGEERRASVAVYEGSIVVEEATGEKTVEKGQKLQIQKTEIKTTSSMSDGPRELVPSGEVKTSWMQDSKVVLTGQEKMIDSLKKKMSLDMGEQQKLFSKHAESMRVQTEKKKGQINDWIKKNTHRK